jgi:toluene monooxygenase system protein A
MILSIQTDETRHSQQGGPTLKILVEHDPRRAQWIIDKTFWVSARLFSVLTGPAMDYYTPLQRRKQSYQEFMQEWVAGQFLDHLRDYGLKKPWYCDEFRARGCGLQLRCRFTSMAGYGERSLLDRRRGRCRLIPSSG